MGGLPSRLACVQQMIANFSIFFGKEADSMQLFGRRKFPVLATHSV